MADVVFWCRMIVVVAQIVSNNIPVMVMSSWHFHCKCLSSLFAVSFWTKLMTCRVWGTCWKFQFSFFLKPSRTDVRFWNENSVFAVRFISNQAAGFFDGSALFMSVKLAFSRLSFEELKQSAHRVVCIISNVMRIVKGVYHQWRQQCEFEVCCLAVLYTAHWTSNGKNWRWNRKLWF